MKKYVTPLFLLVFASTLYGQIDSTKVAFIAYWSKGDTYDFKVTKIKKKWTNDQLTTNDSTQYIANFKVLDSTENTYTLQWSYKSNLVNTYAKSLHKIYEDKKAVNKIVKDYNVTKIIYKTDEYGEFLEVINYEEIGSFVSKIMGELEKSILAQKPDKLDEVKKIIAPIARAYSSKEGIEQLLLYELQYFHFPFGVEYDINDTFEYEQELPNMFGSEPIKGTAKLSIEEVDFSEYYCVLKEEVLLNPNDTKREVMLLLKKMGFAEVEIDEALKTAILDITDLNYYQYYYDPGVPHRIHGSRKTLLKMQNNEIKNLQELEIELIYKD